jgi:hypothetical protein
LNKVILTGETRRRLPPQSIGHVEAEAPGIAQVDAKTVEPEPVDEMC